MSTPVEKKEVLSSGAFNYSSFIQSGVDPRTGAYSCSLSLSDLLSNHLCGPAIPLVLSFNSFDSRNLGLGTGWSLRMSAYSRTTQKLSLSSGASYQAYANGRDVTLLDKKLDTFNVSVVDDKWIIQHKDGTVEELVRPDPDDDQWLPARIYSADGRHVSFSYDIVQGHRVLRELSDAHHRLLKIDYESDNNWDSSPGITLWPDNPHHRRKFGFVIRDSWLSQIYMGSRDGQEKERWVFDYQPGANETLLITRLQTPAGALETLSYSMEGHALPVGAPLAAMPAVLSCTIIPGAGQPATVRRFEFSAHNYFGNGAGYEWSDSEDYLYRNTSDYTYSSVESVACGNKVKRIERTYNRFHLLIAEQTTVGTKVHHKKIEYHDRDGQDFAAQPAVFQMQKKLTNTYYDSLDPASGEYSEVTRTSYDSFGNLLELISPSGAREVYVYYAAAGENGCPPSPSGRPHYLKSKRVIPAPDYVHASATNVEHTYLDLPSLRDNSQRFIVLRSDGLYENSAAQPTVRTTYSYITDTAHPFYGKPSAKTEHMGGNSTAYAYAYAVNEKVVGFSQTVEVGNQFYAQLIECDVFTGQEVNVNDHAGHVVETLYDGLGRLQQETVKQGAKTVSRTYRYPGSEEGTARVRQVLLDSRGQEHITVLDGLGRTIEVYEQDIDYPGAIKPLRETYRASYNEWGQMTQEITTDWFDGDPQPQAVTFIYDDWGKAVQVIQANGTIANDTFDPVTRTRVQWLRGGGKTLTVINAFAKPNSIERVDTQGRSLGITLYTYDGFGRCLKTVTPESLTTSFTYDLFGRVIETRLPDGVVVTREYDPRSAGDHPVAIKANGYALGHRTYDALMRVSTTTVGGRTEQLEYERGQAEPSRKTCASGKVINFSLDPVFKGEVAERSVENNSNVVSRFNRDALHGQLLQASNRSSQENYHYYASGRLKRKEYLIEKKQFETSHAYSLLGKVMRFTDVLGNHQHYRYDPFGRLERIEANTLITTYSYDQQGALKSLRVNDSHTGYWLNTDLIYDDFGREIQRTFTSSESPVLVIEQSFTSEDKLQRRTLRSQETVLRDETFRYDKRGRLNRYACSGSQGPVDAWGNTIISQLYEHDELDNIIRLTTHFRGGENITTFHYDYLDRTQLSSVTHSHPDYSPRHRRFEYDDDGNQLNDELGRLLGYDELGCLCSVAAGTSSTSSTLVEYRYTPSDNIQSSRSAAGVIKEFFYHEGFLTNELQGEHRRSYVRYGAHAVAQTDGNDCLLLSTDSQGSVIQAASKKEEARVTYTPYGGRPLDDGMSSLLGFNGELPDPYTGCYLLGNGYRAYNPLLMRFHTPDSLSVFDGGGLNAYAYCLGDPVNYLDPTGHITSFQGIKMGLAIGLAVAALALTVFTFGAAAPTVGLSITSIISLVYDVVSTAITITSAVLDELAPDSTVAKAFSYASIALGVVSGGNAVVGKLAQKGLSTASQKTIERVGKAAAAQSTWSGAKLTTASRPMSTPSASLRGNGGVKNLRKLHAQLQTASKVKDGIDYTGYVFTAVRSSYKHREKVADVWNSDGFQEGLSYLNFEPFGRERFFTGECSTQAHQKLPLETFLEGVEGRVKQIRST